MLTPAERSALLRTVDRIALELGGGAPAEAPGPGEEPLAAALRRSLAGVAAAAGGGRPAERAAGTALDAAEMVARGEIAMGNETRLPALLPVFVFLVTVPIVGLDRAIEISERCTQLLQDSRPPGQAPP